MKINNLITMLVKLFFQIQNQLVMSRLCILNSVIIDFSIKNFEIRNLVIEAYIFNPFSKIKNIS